MCFMALLSPLVLNGETLWLLEQVVNSATWQFLAQKLGNFETLASPTPPLRSVLCQVRLDCLCLSAGMMILGVDLLRAFQTLFPPLLGQNPEQNILSLGAPAGHSSLSVIQGLPQTGPKLPSTTPCLSNMFLALPVASTPLGLFLDFFFSQCAFSSLVYTSQCVDPV